MKKTTNKNENSAKNVKNEKSGKTCGKTKGGAKDCG